MPGRLTVAEKERLAELVEAKTPFLVICELIGRDRWTTRRNFNYLKRKPAPEPKRSPLRLSLAEREEISRGQAVKIVAESRTTPVTVLTAVRLLGSCRRNPDEQEQRGVADGRPPLTGRVVV
jgi:hypothetical protein